MAYIVIAAQALGGDIDSMRQEMEKKARSTDHLRVQACECLDMYAERCVDMEMVEKWRNTGMCVCASVRACVRACVRAFVRACMRACLCAFVRAFMCACLHACIFLCKHACVRAVPVREFLYACLGASCASVRPCIISNIQALSDPQSRLRLVLASPK